MAGAGLDITGLMLIMPAQPHEADQGLHPVDLVHIPMPATTGFGSCCGLI
jgi:hypothetical protein